MTDQEIRTKSAAKVKQVKDLMEVLQIDVHAKQLISPEGFIETVVIFRDDEKYERTEEPVHNNAPDVQDSQVAEQPKEATTEPVQQE